MADQATTLKTHGKRSSLRFFLVVLAVIIVVGAIRLVSDFDLAWEKMVRLDCQGNLRELGIPCFEYAAKHDGHFPSTWSELNFVGADANWSKLLRCPSTHHETGTLAKVDLWADYRLLPGRSTNDVPNTILALEPLANHKSIGANVLFVDGSTAWWPAARLLGNSTNLSISH
jgi:prepilin-type processing-associated H-X9-DG protein